MGQLVRKRLANPQKRIYCRGLNCAQSFGLAPKKSADSWRFIKKPSVDSFQSHGYEVIAQGCQIFIHTIYQNKAKYTKLPQHYRMAIKYTKRPPNDPNDHNIVGKRSRIQL
jgi:hypothetical protein